MKPLAERLRPKALADIVGQQHLIGKGKVLHAALQSGRIPSIILWGPPGVGKTTMARIIANQSEKNFHALSAINAGVKDIRDVLKQATESSFFNQKGTILFIDEIHRFNKSQQDALLGAVEDGTITLIGATTENPSFEVNSALLSRCQVYVLEALEEEELLQLLDHALKNDELLLKSKIKIKSTDDLLRISAGDARKLLSALELTVDYQLASGEIVISNETVSKAVQSNLYLFDKGGEYHYDVASAFIKSIRGSDPNAAVYWLARMIEGGEDVNFIARRLVISAAEDIGLANPNALLLANACAQSVRLIGYPEARIILSQAAIYLATSPKSNTSYMAIKKAQEEVRSSGNASVPLHLRNAATSLMKDLEYGKGYQYSHDHKDNFSDQEFLPKKLSGLSFWEAGDNVSETKIKERMKRLWKSKYKF